jgi:hypothetical protein
VTAAASPARPITCHPRSNRYTPALLKIKRLTSKLTECAWILYGTGCCMFLGIPPLWSSGQEFLATDPEVRVPFPALPDFLSSVSGTESTQPREYN